MDNDIKLKVLIVEDDSDTALSAKKLLNGRFSTAVETAEDLGTARSLLEEKSFDLVLLDYQLPDGDGLELLKEIKSRESAPSVIMVTGRGDEEIAAEAFRLHASGYLVKDQRLASMLPEVVGSALAEISLKRAQDALKRGEEIERALLNATTESIIMLDLSGSIIAINETGAARFSLTVDEAVGSSFYGLLPEDLARSRKASIDEVFKTGEPVRFHDERNDTYFDISVYPIRSESGEVTGVALFAHDETDQKRAEEELKRAHDELEHRVEERTAALAKANEDLRTEITERKRAEGSLRILTEQVQEQAGIMDEILSTSPDYFFLVDKNGKNIYASVHGEEMLGLEPSEISGTYWRDLKFPPETMKRLEIERQKVFSSGHSITSETEFPTVNGKRDFEYILSPIHRPDGTVSAVVATVRDITESKRAKRELENYAIRLEEQAQLLDLIQETVFVRDMTSVLTFWNKAAEEMYGWTREEAIGKISYDLLTTEFPEPLPDIEREILAEGTWEGELVHTTRDGRRVRVKSRWALRRDRNGMPAGIMELNLAVEALNGDA